MSATFLDDLREAIASQSLPLFDAATGAVLHKGKPSFKATVSIVLSRYACHAPPLDEALKQQVLAFLNRSIPERDAKLPNAPLWNAIRAIRSLDGEPSQVPACYKPLLKVADFEAWLSGHGRLHDYTVRALMPLVASAPDQRHIAALIAHIKLGKHGAHSSATINLMTLAERVSELKRRLEIPKPVPDSMPVLFRVHESDHLCNFIRLGQAIGDPRSERVWAALRAGLPAMKERFAAKHAGKLQLQRIHGDLECFALLQEIAPAELPSRRPYRFGRAEIDLYRCRVITEAIRAAN